MITLKRRMVTNLSCLKPGDRFCFATDPAKKVYQVQKHTAIYFRGILKKLTTCINDKKQQQRFSSGRSIWFLRHQLATFLFLISYSLFVLTSCGPWYKGGKQYQDKAGNLHKVPMNKRKSLFH